MATKRTPDQLPNPKSSMWAFIAFYLRFRRNQAGLSGEAMGRIMKVGKSKVSRIEIGQERLDWQEAEMIDKEWDTGGLFGLLVWYASLGHDPQWFAQYLDLEVRAGVISAFEAQVVPGLLQTEDYARALLISGDANLADQLLRERIERQLIFNRVSPPHFTTILSQNALEWPIGSPEIMRAQLARLLECAELSNFVVRVVPRSWQTGACPGLDGSFVRMSGDDFGEVAYAESPEGGRLVSAPPDVRKFHVRYDRISAKALPEGPSRDLIRQVMEALSE
ncbi:helix-turn-helix domain-containing protein [Actinomadura rugatobispora]|uniref:Helix-turn-helix domain-containing protein n=1 Tax=Actinomadura rugatobispora TaxID=1994 RepID=A0ABW1AAL9_9ACTN|nr:helix-turn-helix transcriptional regulator [Actinomadura rugatobispora]